MCMYIIVMENTKIDKWYDFIMIMHEYSCGIEDRKNLSPRSCSKHENKEDNRVGRKFSVYMELA